MSSQPKQHKNKTFKIPTLKQVKKIKTRVNVYRATTKRIYLKKLNSHTSLFRTMLLRCWNPGNKKLKPVHEIRTFLTKQPITFFSRTTPSKKNLFHLLFPYFVTAAETLCHVFTYLPTSFLSYKTTIREISTVTQSYLLFFLRPASNYFYFTHNYHTNVYVMHYFLNLKFVRRRFFASIYDSSDVNYLTLGVGLFASLTQRRKSFKKNILLKLLMMRFLRKMFIAMSFNNIYLRVRGAPVDLTRLIATLNRPVIHTYIDPFRETIVDEKSAEHRKYLKQNPWLITPYIHFTKTKSYTFMKTRKRGRIKRKIRRRLVKLNRTVD